MNKYEKAIYDYEGLYTIDRDSKVYGVKRGKYLKQFISNGYYCVNLSKNNKVKQHRIHRLFATAFIINVNNKPHINHKDGNKLNNNIDNIEWVSLKENTQHAWRIGLIKKEMFEKAVIQFDLDMNVLNIFASIKSALRFINANELSSHISECCKGKLKTAYGYKWEHLSYIEDILERATPKKVNWKSRNEERCPNANCDTLINWKQYYGCETSFCPVCSQALDWSE